MVVVGINIKVILYITFCNDIYGQVECKIIRLFYIMFHNYKCS